jgi:hypothetical protein
VIYYLLFLCYAPLRAFSASFTKGAIMTTTQAAIQELYDSIWNAIEPSLTLRGTMPSIQALLRMTAVLGTTSDGQDLEVYLHIALAHYFRQERKKAKDRNGRQWASSS